VEPSRRRSNLSILSAQLKIAWKMLSGTGRLLWKARKPLLVLGVFAALLLTTTTLLPSTRLQGDRHLVALVFSSTATAKTHGIPAEQAAQTQKTEKREEGNKNRMGRVRRRSGTTTRGRGNKRGGNQGRGSERGRSKRRGGDKGGGSQERGGS